MEAATLTADAQRIMAGKGWEDYIACVVNGQSRKERSDATGKSPSSVSAAIGRIQGYIDDGTVPDPRTEGGAMMLGDGKVTLADRRDIAEEQMPGASMFIEQTAKLDDEFDRLELRITQAQEDLSTVDDRRKVYRDLAEQAGFKWDEFDAAVAAAEQPTEEKKATDAAEGRVETAAA